MDVSKQYIAKIIRNARKKRGLKQSELAEKIGISEKHLSKIETGKNYPALDNFFKIISILNLSLDDFGLKDNFEISKNRQYLKDLVYTSSEKQLGLYIDVINALKTHF